MTLAEKIAASIMKEHRHDLQDFCKANAFTVDELTDFLSFGVQAYSDYLQLMNEGDKNGKNA